MACLFNNHVVTNGTGILVATPAVGQDCDCGKTIAQYTGAGQLIWQETPNGRLVGR